MEKWVPLAEVARPHGVRGELRLKVFNRDSDLLLDLEKVLVRGAGDERTMTIDHARRANEAILLKLRGIDDRDAADALRGATICARRAELPELDDGEFYACDVEGARVLLGDREVGVVRALRSYPTVDVLYVEGERRWEVPLTDVFIDRVAPADGVVVLKTLNDLEPV